MEEEGWKRKDGRGRMEVKNNSNNLRGGGRVREK